MPDYDTDFYAWTQAQAAALRAKDWDALDLDHLAEEVEDVGNSVRFALESQLVRLLLHLLKLAIDPTARPRRGWRGTVDAARHEIAKRATGSLRQHPTRYLPEAYRQARRHAALMLDRPLADVPEICPWTIDQVLDEDFWPDMPASAPESHERRPDPSGPRVGPVAPRLGRAMDRPNPRAPRRGPGTP
jgi:hypothetical protein